MKRRAAIVCLASLPVLVSCAATMTMEEFDCRFPPSTPPIAERMPQEDDSDTVAARRAAAERYFEVVDLEGLVAEAVHEEAKTLPASEREAFLGAAHAAFSLGSFRLGMRDLAVKHYSRAQLVALMEFVETREGRSAWWKSSRRSGPPEPSDTVAIARGADKEAFVKKLGARVYIDSEKQDPAAELTKLGGARAILATATSGEAMTAVLGGLGVDGVLEVVGAPPDPLQVPAYLLIAGRRSVAGWASGRPIDSEDTMAFAVKTGVRSMNEPFPLDRAPEAYDRMMSGKARFRMVLTMK